jgi:hypothetical protein
LGSGGDEGLVEQVRLVSAGSATSVPVVLFWFSSPSLKLPPVGTADAARGTKRAVKYMKNNIVVKGVVR